MTSGWSFGGSGSGSTRNATPTTLHGHVALDPSSTAADVGRMVRAEQEQAERTRPSWQDMTTVDFARLDDHDDWTDV